VAAWLPEMYCNSYLANSHEIGNNSATTQAKKKIEKMFVIRRKHQVLIKERVENV
jgi:hypothetical protein